MSKILTPRNRSGLTGVGHALRPAVHPPARLLDRHEQQVVVDGEIALAARTRHRHVQLRLARILDVVEVEAVESCRETGACP